jgi:hypothetical protein
MADIFGCERGPGKDLDVVHLPRDTFPDIAIGCKLPSHFLVLGHDDGLERSGLHGAPVANKGPWKPDHPGSDVGFLTAGF